MARLLVSAGREFEPPRRLRDPHVGVVAGILPFSATGRKPRRKHAVESGRRAPGAKHRLTWDEAVDSFLAEKRLDGRARQTIRNHEWVLKGRERQHTCRGVPWAHVMRGHRTSVPLVFEMR
jgi:hypothetical protein